MKHKPKVATRSSRVDLEINDYFNIKKDQNNKLTLEEENFMGLTRRKFALNLKAWEQKMNLL
jgi:hypothetical protein